MTCKRYEEYELGQIEENFFKEHARTCSECRKRLEEDDVLMKHVRSMSEPIEAPHLWERIERDLEAERRKEALERISPRRQRMFRFARAAAVILIAVGLGYYIGVRTPVRDSKILTQTALQRVESLEREHIQAIAELEAQAEPVLAAMDLELALLYRDRLETIDAQIQSCREALAENPGNAHVRHYMLAALQDKRETLSELLRTV
jgi:hypothetical protein